MGRSKGKKSNAPAKSSNSTPPTETKPVVVAKENQLPQQVVDPPVAVENVKSPVAEEVKSSVVPENAKSPVVNEEVKSSVVPENAKSPVVNEEVKSSVVPENAKSPVVNEEVKSSVVPENAKSPVVNEEVKSPVAAENAKSPVVNEEVKSSVVPENSESPEVVKNIKSPVAAENAKSPVVKEEVKSPVVPENSKSPVVKEEIKSPVVLENSKSPEVVKNIKSPVAAENAKSPVVKEAVKSPVVEKSKCPVVAAVAEKLKCPICQKTATSKCAGCSKVAYCSRDHQKAHWKTHKGNCGLYKISESPELGRYLTAVRDIKPGKTIFQEPPLILTPPKVTNPVCLGCYREFTPPDEEVDPNQTGEDDVRPKKCLNDCGWPMCNSQECKQNRADHEAECKISASRGGLCIRHFDQAHPMYQAIGILRALTLRHNRPEAFTQLLSLVSNEEKQKQQQIDALKAEKEQREQEEAETGQSFGNEQQQVLLPHQMPMTVSLVQDFFKQDKTETPAELITKISAIIETNGHEIPVPGNFGQLSRRLIGVYHISSFLEHNCRPNCVKSWDSKTRAIIIRSAVTINKGDHLSISYVDPLWGTNDRQNFLQMTKFFTCKCERCSDPTELATHISSIRCQQVQCLLKLEAQEKAGGVQQAIGMIVPLNPLDPESDWKCNTCGENYNASYASCIAQKIGNELENFQENRGDIAAEEEFIRKYSKIVAPNHFYLLEMKVELSQLYGRTASEPLPTLPPQKLLRKISLCEEVLKVLNIIVPGYNRLRNLILYELQAAIGMLSKVKHSVGGISTKTHIEELLQCRLMLLEVTKVLAWEPVLSVEYRRCEGAKIELKDLEALIETMKELQMNLDSFSAAVPNNMKTNFQQQQAAGSNPSSSSNNVGNNNLMITSSDFDDELELF